MRWLVYIILLIALSSFALAAQTQINIPIEISSLTIVYPKEQFVPVNYDLLLQFDILNSSLARLTNTTTSCIFVTVDNIGIIRSAGSLYYNKSIGYWTYPISAAVNNKVGDYNYYVHCNATNGENGFVTQTLKITQTGFSDINDYSALNIVVIFLTLIMILLIVFAVMSKPIYAKIGLGLMSAVLFMLNLMFIYLIVQRANVAAILELIEPIYHLSVLLIRYAIYGVAFFMLYWIVNLFFRKKDRGTNIDKELDEI